LQVHITAWAELNGLHSGNVATHPMLYEEPAPASPAWCGPPMQAPSSSGSGAHEYVVVDA
jgi:hypothetical protein